MHLYSNVCYNFNRYKMKSILMTFMGVGTIMNLTAGNLSEDRTDQPQTDGGKVLTMEEAVLGKHRVRR